MTDSARTLYSHDGALPGKKAPKVAHTLPRSEFLRLDDAVNYALLGVRAKTGRDNSAEFFEHASSMARPGAILYGIPPKKQEAAIFQFEERLSQAACEGVVQFRGVRGPVGGYDSETSLESPTELKSIPSWTFCNTRGFDVETCMITFTSYYAEGDFVEEAIEGTLKRPDAYAEWMNVVVERQGYLKWLDRVYPSIRRGYATVSESQVRKALEEEIARRGGFMGQNAACSYISSRGWKYDRKQTRAICQKITGNLSRGRPRKVPESRRQA